MAQFPGVDDMPKIDLRDYLDKRLPIGVLLLAYAAFCVWRGQWPDDPAWWIAGACVGFFGLLAVGERHFVVVDDQARSLIRKRGIIFVVTRTSLSFADIKAVELTKYTVKSSGRRGSGTTRYRITVAGPQSRALANFKDEWHARRVAERLSSALRVPFDNRVYGRRSVRKSDELDLPVAERWRMAGKVKERPASAEGSQVTIEDQTPQVRVYFPASNRAALQGVLLIAVVFGAFGALFHPLMEGADGRGFFYIFLGFVCVFLLLSVLTLSGSSRLTFTDASVSFRQGLAAPIERSIELRSIEEMIHGWDAIYLVGDSARLAIDWPESDQDRDFLKALVAYEIARRHQMTARMEA